MLEEKGFKILKINWNKYGATFQVEAQKIKALSKDDYIKLLILSLICHCLIIKGITGTMK